MKDLEWSELFFTDESNFEMNYFNKILWYQDKSSLIDVEGNYFQKNEKVMIAGVISYNGNSSLKIWKITNIDSNEDERVNAVAYRDFLLQMEPEMTSLYPLQNLELILDNAKPHLACAKAFLEAQSIFIQPNFQPASSPDLQPIEMIWAWLKRKVYSQIYNSLNELINLIKHAWEELPIQVIRNCIDHCYKRCHSVYNSRGGWPL